jgi:aminoglycoside phosphotransferase (APT) family kinase protein
MTVDIEKPDELRAYLSRRGRIESDEPVKIELLRGGVSNKTVRLERESGEAWVLKQALPRLRVPTEWLSDPARIHIEAEALRTLPAVTPAGSIPPFVFEDEQENLLAMQAVPDPHENWKRQLLSGRLQALHVHQFAKLLASIHREAQTRSALLRERFANRSFFKTLRLDPYYRYSASVQPASSPFLSDLIDETLGQALTLVHGDYSPKNILVYQDQLILLDHEVVHWGDPAFDLGFSLTHFLSKAHHLQAYRRAFAEVAALYWQSYRTETQALPWCDELEPRVVRHTAACLLARTVGRSPLEYLSVGERIIQRDAALKLIDRIPDSVEHLIEQFLGYLG